MSIHERIYEGTLNWPVKITPQGILCLAGKDEQYPAHEDDEQASAAELCGAVVIPADPGKTLDSRRVLDAVERHMFDDHHHEV